MHVLLLLYVLFVYIIIQGYWLQVEAFNVSNTKRSAAGHDSFRSIQSKSDWDVWPQFEADKESEKAAA